MPQTQTQTKNEVREVNDLSSSAQGFTPKTALGRKLAALRAEIVASGEPLLDWAEVAREVAERREEHEADVS